MHDLHTSYTSAAPLRSPPPQRSCVHARVTCAIVVVAFAWSMLLHTSVYVVIEICFVCWLSLSLSLSRALRYTVCGVLINMMGDDQGREVLSATGGIKSLIDVRYLCLGLRVWLCGDVVVASVGVGDGVLFVVFWFLMVVLLFVILMMRL